MLSLTERVRALKPENRSVLGTIAVAFMLAGPLVFLGDAERAAHVHGPIAPWAWVVGLVLGIGGAAVLLLLLRVERWDSVARRGGPHRPVPRRPRHLRVVR